MGRSRGPRRKTRQRFRKPPRERGIQPLGRLLHEYGAGEKVVIKIDPSVHKGMPHSRYHGRVGDVEGKRGRAYVVKLRAGDKLKTLIVRPEHVKPHQS